jgi:hypothetical protein
MIDPFDNPEIAAASRKRGGGGRVANAAILTGRSCIPETPRARPCRGVFVSPLRNRAEARPRHPGSSAAIPRAGRTAGEAGALPIRRSPCSKGNPRLNSTR